MTEFVVKNKNQLDQYVPFWTNKLRFYIPLSKAAISRTFFPANDLAKRNTTKVDMQHVMIVNTMKSGLDKNGTCPWRLGPNMNMQYWRKQTRKIIKTECNGNDMVLLITWLPINVPTFPQFTTKDDRVRNQLNSEALNWNDLVGII